MAFITRPRGTNDIIPGEIEQWLELEQTIRQICHAYGYQELRTPMFEYTELFQRGIGDTTDIVEKEMYTFEDRGKRSITLRPEGTAPIVRAYLENKLGSGSLPVKVYYYGPMFRYERPQAGRYRQFTQFGLEVLGSADPLLDVEAIVLPLELYKACGLTDDLQGFTVELNSIGCSDCRQEYRHELLAYFEPRAEKLCANCQGRLQRNPLRLLDCKNEKCQETLNQAPRIDKYLCDECADHFSEVRQYLSALGIKYQLNSRLVRGFDYYTRTVFEVAYAELGSQNAIGAGGRYDGLVEECGGVSTPAVGFAVGVERLLLALQTKKKMQAQIAKPAAYFIHFGGETKVKAAQIAHILRSRGFWIELDYLGRSMRAQMKAANRLGSRFVFIFGEDELLRNEVLVRNMQDGHEQSFALNDLEALTRSLA